MRGSQIPGDFVEYPAPMMMAGGGPMMGTPPVLMGGGGLYPYSSLPPDGYGPPVGQFYTGMMVPPAGPGNRAYGGGMDYSSPSGGGGGLGPHTNTRGGGRGYQGRGGYKPVAPFVPASPPIAPGFISADARQGSRYIFNHYIKNLIEL